MAETRTITGIPGIKPSVWGTYRDLGEVSHGPGERWTYQGAPYQQAALNAAALAGRVPGGHFFGNQAHGPNADPIDRAEDAFSQVPRQSLYEKHGIPHGGVSLENLSKLLATLSMQGARRKGVTDITAQESGSGFSPIQRDVRDWGPDYGRARRAIDIARETPRDTLYQRAGGTSYGSGGMRPKRTDRGTQGFGLGRRGPSEFSQREGEQDHARALARKMLEGRSVNRGDPADVLRRYGGGLRRDDPAPVNYRRQAPTFDRFNR